MKKRALLYIILLITVIILSYNSYAQSSISIAVGADVRVTFINQDPDPVEPGSVVDVRFKFENIGSEKVDEVTVELLPEFPFSILPGTSPEQKLGSLHSQQIGENGVIIKFKLQVDDKANEGDNDLNLRYKIGKNVYINLMNFQYLLGLLIQFLVSIQ